MSASGVYVHYRAKHDLLYAIGRVGQEAVLATVTDALAQASPNPVERISEFGRTFAKWHTENHTLARVNQYEFKNLPTRQSRRLVGLREKISDLLAVELNQGVAAGAFEIEELEGTTLAILSLCIVLARIVHETVAAPLVGAA